MEHGTVLFFTCMFERPHDLFALPRPPAPCPLLFVACTGRHGHLKPRSRGTGVTRWNRRPGQYLDIFSRAPEPPTLQHPRALAYDGCLLAMRPVAEARSMGSAFWDVRSSRGCSACVLTASSGCSLRKSGLWGQLVLFVRTLRVGSNTQCRECRDGRDTYPKTCAGESRVGLIGAGFCVRTFAFGVLCRMGMGRGMGP